MKRSHRRKLIKLHELKEYYNGCILNKYVKNLLEAKKNDYLIVPIWMINQEYFELSEEYIELLKNILNDMGYFNSIPKKGITQDLMNRLLNH